MQDATSGPITASDQPAAIACGSSDVPAEGPPGLDITEQLAALRDRPVEEHPELYEAIHQRLGDVLAGIDDG